MWLRDLRETKSVWKSLAILAGIYLLQFRLVDILPIYRLDIDWILIEILARAVNVGVSLFFIWLLAPQSFQRMRLKIEFMTRRRWFATIFLLAFVPVAILIYQGATVLVIFDSLIYAFLIGLDEEIFARGLIFGVLERYGREFSLILSALIFGALHFQNYLFGGESFDYVLGHVVEAAAGGYMLGSLMLASGSIWLPVVAHACIDVRWVGMDSAKYAEIVSGTSNWWLTIAIAVTMVGASRILLFITDENFKIPQFFHRSAKYLGLIED